MAIGSPSNCAYQLLHLRNDGNHHNVKALMQLVVPGLSDELPYINTTRHIPLGSSVDPSLNWTLFNILK